MVVVFPTPLTPTTMMTYGIPFSGKSNELPSLAAFSFSKATISSRSTRFSSSTPIYLSRSTRASIRWIMRNVVSTPTSDEISTSSRLSSTSSSTFDFPTIALANFLKTLSFVFSRPLSKDSFFAFPNKPNNPMPVLIIKIRATKLRIKLHFRVSFS